jgi:hydrogenase nickel incorporation protein HypB
MTHLLDTNICSAHMRLLLSVTEGEDKPLKYPPIFNSADVALITKIDLATAVEFDRAAANRSIQSVRPGMQVFEVSAKTGQGMDDWLHFLNSRLVDSRSDAANTASKVGSAFSP